MKCSPRMRTGVRRQTLVMTKFLLIYSSTQKQAEERAHRAIARAVRCEEKQPAKQVLMEAPCDTPK